MAGRRVPGLMLGEAVAAVYASMAHPLAGAAAVLGPVARAMTDVTGFGLAGHLREMLAATRCGASLVLADLPLLPGAEAFAAAGVASSLAPANRAAVAGWARLPQTARAALLVDPQTAGGLLAAVPPERLPAVLTDLAAAQEPVWVIGEVTQTPGLTIQTTDER
jgi:selenide,water dikinase